MLLTENIEKRCAVTTDDVPRRQLISSVGQYPGVRVVNVPSDTYQHHSELESSSDIHTIITLNSEVLISTSLYTIAFIYRHSI